MSWGDHDNDLINKKLGIEQRLKDQTKSKSEITFKVDELRKDIITKRFIVLNITMDEACKQIGISKATLSRLENSKLPDVETLGKVCDWLGTTPNKYYSKS